MEEVLQLAPSACTAPGDRRAGIQRETGAAYHADRSRHLSGIRIER